MSIPEGYMTNSYEQMLEDVREGLKTSDRTLSTHDCKVYAAKLLRESLSEAYNMIADIEGLTLRDCVNISSKMYDIEQILDHVLQTFYDREDKQ